MTMPDLLLVGWRDDATLNYLTKELAHRDVVTKLIDFETLLRGKADVEEATCGSRKAYLRWIVRASDYGNPYLVDLSRRLRAFGADGVMGSVRGNETNFSKFVHLQSLADTCASHGVRLPKTCAGVGTNSHVEEQAGTGRLVVKGASARKSVCRILERDHINKRVGSKINYLVQERLEGPDIRVHYIAGTLIAELAVADDVDYRFARRKRFSSIDLPEHISSVCHAIAGRVGAVLAGIDFRLSSDGAWYFLEVNSAPAFQGYDRRSGGQIVDAIARWVAADAGGQLAEE